MIILYIIQLNIYKYAKLQFFLYIFDIYRGIIETYTIVSVKILAYIFMLLSKMIYSDQSDCESSKTVFICQSLLEIKKMS